MSVGADGIKRGTNYIHRAKIAAMRGMAPRQIGAALAQDIACAEGHHAEATARQDYVTYVGGEQVAPGTRYCHRCQVIIHKPEQEG